MVSLQNARAFLRAGKKSGFRNRGLSPATGMDTRHYDRTIIVNEHKLGISKMNTLHVKGDWNIVKGKLKQKYAKLTENDLRYEEGREDELIGRIQKRTGDTKEAVEQFIDECFRS